MHTDLARALIVLGAAGLLAGCETTDATDLVTGGRDNFGVATTQTFAAQVINPDPVYDTDVPTTSGEHAAQAVDRYRTDKVKQPQRVQTSEVLSGGSSSSTSGN